MTVPIYTQRRYNEGLSDIAYVRYMSCKDQWATCPKRAAASAFAKRYKVSRDTAYRHTTLGKLGNGNKAYFFNYSIPTKKAHSITCKK